MARLSPELRETVTEALLERFGEEFAQGERLTFDGGEEARLTWVRIVLEGGPDGARFDVQARVSHDDASGTRAREVALDAADLVLQEILASGRSLRLPGVFEGRELGGVPVEVCAERTFPALESLADKILGSRDPCES
jgi:hypothetical protein